MVVLQNWKLQNNHFFLHTPHILKRTAFIIF